VVIATNEEWLAPAQVFCKMVVMNSILPSNFTAIDVETANADLSSICQVGIVTFENGSLKEKWETFVNPEDEFDGMNVSIHGITEATVKDAPTFPQIHRGIETRLSGRIVVTHTHFDVTAITRAQEKHGLSRFDCSWLDTAKVVRRAWPEFAQSGYGLKPVAKKLGISFGHHNAAEDARAAGEILLFAIRETAVPLNGWFERVKRPISPANISLEGNPEGPLHGEVIVFTGALAITRAEAATLAAGAGCTVVPGVNSKTTLLVVGDQDIRALAGHEKSSKHRKAEELITKGQPIRILRESDFKFLLSHP
jgi:DNA polymerase-3 subunit epsilon